MLLQASREVVVANLQLYQVITEKMAQASDKVTIECVNTKSYPLTLSGSDS